MEAFFQRPPLNQPGTGTDTSLVHGYSRKKRHHRAFFLGIGIDLLRIRRRSRLIQDIHLPVALFHAGSAVGLYEVRNFQGNQGVRTHLERRAGGHGVVLRVPAARTGSGEARSKRLVTL